MDHLRYDPEKDDKAQCLEAVVQPEKWPMRPFLPLKKKGVSNQNSALGYIVESVPFIVFLNNVYNTDSTPSNSVKYYNSWDELFDDWTID